MRKLLFIGALGLASCQFFGSGSKVRDRAAVAGSARVLGSTWDDVPLAFRALPQGEFLVAGKSFGYERALWLGALGAAGLTRQGIYTGRRWDHEPLAGAFAADGSSWWLTVDRKQLKRNEPPEAERATLLHLDSQGKILSQTSLSLPGIVTPFSSLSHVSLALDQRDVLLAWRSRDAGRELSVARFDASGRAAWTRKVLAPTDFRVSRIVPLSNGDALALGDLVENGSNDGLAVRLSPSGKVLWSWSFGGERFDTLRSATETRDGEILLVGETESFGARNADFWSVLVNEDGKVITSRRHDAGGDEGLVDATLAGGKAFGVVGNLSTRGGDVAWFELDADLADTRVGASFGGEALDAPTALAYAGGRPVLLAESTSYGHGKGDLVLLQPAADGRLETPLLKDTPLRLRESEVSVKERFQEFVTEEARRPEGAEGNLEPAPGEFLVNALDTRFVRFLEGNPGDVERSTRPGVVVMGGSTDVDAAMRWMVERSGGGDVVVLRASGTPAYNSYLFRDLGGMDSVETLVVDSRERAASPEVNRIVREAEALFIAGGDQWDYVKFWKGTPLIESIHWAVREKKIPVGGTSSGANVMGGYLFTAENDAVASEEALADPYHEKIQLSHADLFLFPGLERTLADSHFNKPDRMGRMLTFLARLLKEGARPEELRGIGVDQRTAVAIDENGLARVFSVGTDAMNSGYAYFLRPLAQPTRCEARLPLSFARDSVRVVRVKGTPEGSESYHLRDETGGETFKLGVDAGRLSADIVPDFPSP